PVPHPQQCPDSGRAGRGAHLRLAPGDGGGGHRPAAGGGAPRHAAAGGGGLGGGAGPGRGGMGGVVRVLRLVAVLRAMQRRVVVAWDAFRTRVGESLAAISESIQGAAVIRAYGVQAQAQRRVMRAGEGRRRAEVRAGTIGAFFFPSGELFGVLATAAVLLVGMAIGPAGGLTIGTLVAFAFLVTIFLEPVAEFTEILDMTQQAVAGWKKVLDVLDTPVEVED